MSEMEVENAAVQDAPSRSVGELLREARLKQNLEAADVARQLRLGLRQIEALEANEFTALPGNTIVRGFIRNYAKLLHADPHVFLMAYEASLPRSEAPRITASAENIDISARPSRRWLFVLVGVIAFVAGVPLLIYSMLRDDSALHVNMPASPAHVTAPAAPVSSTPVAGNEPQLTLPLPAAKPVPTAPLETAPAAVDSKPQPSPEPKPADTKTVSRPAPQTDVKNAAIQLAFDEDAWVEIRDRTGQRVYSKIGSKGSSESVSGEAPFNLVIGNATKVHLSYKGKPLDLKPYIKVNVARLTLE